MAIKLPAAIVIWLVWPMLSVSAMDRSIPAIGGDESRRLLGDGKDVVIAFVDSGVDSTHPALAGVDSRGRPRLAAEVSFVEGEPSSSCADSTGHGTSIASIVLSRDSRFTGLAPDARYLNVRVLDQSNAFPDESWIRSGVAYALRKRANILNLSLNKYAGKSDGNSPLEMMLDWAVQQRRVHVILSAGNIATGDGSRTVRYPGGAWNAITVGTVSSDLQRIHRYSGEAFTADGRMKPDVVAPGTNLTLASHRREGSQADFKQVEGGSSCAAAHVSGLVAQQIAAGRARKLKTDPLVIKATLLNSAKKVRNKLNQPWRPAHQELQEGIVSIDEPLDAEAGAGLVDGRALAEQYLAGQQKPGSVGLQGWDLNRIRQNESLDYQLNNLKSDKSELTATLTWNRHVQRVDLGEAGVDVSDTFQLPGVASDLNLQVFQGKRLIAQSVSKHDNVEHLFMKLEPGAQYTIRVVGTRVATESQEAFCLAWSVN